MSNIEAELDRITKHYDKKIAELQRELDELNDWYESGFRMESRPSTKGLKDFIDNEKDD